MSDEETPDLNFERVTTERAKELMDKEGYVFLDVRTVMEFVAGHPLGAFNIPSHLAGASGVTSNQDFVSVVQGSMPAGVGMVVACRSGNRSQDASRRLLKAGVGPLVELRAGFEGARDPFGQMVEEGWRGAGLPCAKVAEPGRTYKELTEKANAED